MFDERIGDVSGRGKLAADMREIWMMQPRFEKRTGHAPLSLIEQPRFRAGFDFMRLRAEIGEIDVVLADWWQEFSMADDATRLDLIDRIRFEQQQQQPGQPRPARKRRKPARDATSSNESADGQRAGVADGTERGDVEPDDHEGNADHDGANESAEAGAPVAAKKRRRRRSGGSRNSGNAQGPEPTSGSDV